eukprot:4901539-Amphidinium_carterae.1
MSACFTPRLGKATGAPKAPRAAEALRPLDNSPPDPTTTITDTAQPTQTNSDTVRCSSRTR